MSCFLLFSGSPCKEVNWIIFCGFNRARHLQTRKCWWCKCWCKNSIRHDTLFGRCEFPHCDQSGTHHWLNPWGSTSDPRTLFPDQQMFFSTISLSFLPSWVAMMPRWTLLACHHQSFTSLKRTRAGDSTSGCIKSPRLQSVVMTRQVVKSETSGWRQKVLGQL